RSSVRFAESQEQLALLDVVFDEGQRHLVQTGGLLEGELSDRPLGRAERMAQCLLPVAARQCGEEVVRELGQMGLRIGGVEILQRVSNLMVKLRPPGAGERVVRGVPDEGMREQDSTGGTGYCSDDTSAHGLVEDAEELIATAAAHSFERLEVKFTTEHGGEREHVEARRGEVTKPATDHLADSLRDAELLDRAGLEAALLDEQAHHFADEERIALGLGLDRVNERLGRSTAGRHLR